MPESAVCSAETAESLLCCKPDCSVCREMAAPDLVVLMGAFADQLHRAALEKIDSVPVMEPYSILVFADKIETSCPSVVLGAFDSEALSGIAVIAVDCLAYQQKISTGFVIKTDLFTCIFDLIYYLRIVDIQRTESSGLLVEQIYIVGMCGDSQFLLGISGN